MPIRIILCVIAAAIACGTGDAAAAGRRVALVIGNAAYQHTPPLTNPRNDAVDIGAALGKLGFEVVPGTDLTKAEFDKVLREFSRRLQGAEAGVFFYAGHGVQVNDQNYLLPIDAELATADAVEFETVRLDLIQGLMERATTSNILFLDACRNNPLTRNLARALGTRDASIGRGLARAESGVGTLISFSTQPGNVALDGTGRNSPFAAALTAALVDPQQDLTSLLIDVRNSVMTTTKHQQVPWEHSSLTRRFYFAPRPVGLASLSKQEMDALIAADRQSGWRGPVSKIDISGDWGVTLREKFGAEDAPPTWRLGVVLKINDDKNLIVGLRPPPGRDAREAVEISTVWMWWIKGDKSAAFKPGDVVWVAPVNEFIPQGVWDVMQMPPKSSIEAALARQR